MPWSLRCPLRRRRGGCRRPGTAAGWAAIKLSISHCVRSWACEPPSPRRRVQRPRPGAGNRSRRSVAVSFVSASRSSVRTSCSPMYSSGRVFFCLPPPSSVSMSWNSRYSRKSRVALIGAGRDQQLPGALGAVLDRVQQMGLAGAFAAQHGHDLGVRRRRVAVQIDHAQELLAFAGEQLRNVIQARTPRHRDCVRNNCGRDCRSGAASPGRAPAAYEWRRRWTWETSRSLRPALRGLAAVRGTAALRAAAKQTTCGYWRNKRFRDRRATRRTVRGCRRAGRSTGADKSCPDRGDGAAHPGTRRW